MTNKINRPFVIVGVIGWLVMLPQVPQSLGASANGQSAMAENVTTTPSAERGADRRPEPAQKTSAMRAPTEIDPNEMDPNAEIAIIAMRLVLDSAAADNSAEAANIITVPSGAKLSSVIMGTTYTATAVRGFIMFLNKTSGRTVKSFCIRTADSWRLPSGQILDKGSCIELKNGKYFQWDPGVKEAQQNLLAINQRLQARFSADLRAWKVERYASAEKEYRTKVAAGDAEIAELQKDVAERQARKAQDPKKFEKGTTLVFTQRGEVVAEHTIKPAEGLAAAQERVARQRQDQGSLGKAKNEHLALVNRTFQECMKNIAETSVANQKLIVSDPAPPDEMLLWSSYQSATGSTMLCGRVSTENPRELRVGP